MNLEYIIAVIVCVAVVALPFVWIRWSERMDFRRSKKRIENSILESEERQKRLDIDLKKLADQEQERNEEIKQLHVKMVNEHQVK